MPYSHVLLDLDHTLLDTDSSLQLAFVDAMNAADADPIGRYEIFDQINAVMWRQVEAGELTPPQVHIARFEQLVEELALDAPAQLMADAFATGMGSHGDLYEGARELLEALADQATLALVTNGLSGIQRARLDRLDIAHYFETVTISAEVGTAKPDRQIFDITFSALGDPDRGGAVMVGDNLGSDIAGGINAGIDTCWYNPGRCARSSDLAITHEITKLAELIPIVSNV